MSATENDVALRRKLRTKEDIDILRKEAEKTLEQYAGIEKSICKSCKAIQKSALRRNVFISKSLPHPTGHDILRDKIEKDFFTFEAQFTRHCLSMIHEINVIFDVFKKEQTANQIFDLLVPQKDSLKKLTIIDIGRRHLDILCVITENTTWYTRKNTQQLLKEFEVEVTRS